LTVFLSFVQSFNAECLVREAADTTFKVFGMTQLRIKPSLSDSQTNALI